MKKTFLIAFVAIFLPILNIVFAQAPNFSSGYPFSSATYAVVSYKNADADKIAEGPTPSALNYYGQIFSAANLSAALSAPAISYSPSTKTFTLNAAIATYSATNTGGAVGSFSGFGTPTTVSTTLNAPYGIGSDASGNIYVANSGAGNILQYNSSGTYVGVLSTTGATLSNPVGVVFDSQGNYYILNESSSSTVYKYNSAGVLQSSNLISGLNFSYGIAIDASDNLYVTSYPSNGNGTSVQKYNNSTGAVLLTLGTHNLNKPTGVAVDLSGNIYVLMGGSAKVYQFPSTGGNGTLFTSTTTFGTTPYAITTDKSNNVYVANSSGGSVTVYNSSGTSLATLTGLTTPRGLIVDKLGNLYVASTTGNTLTKYPPNGGFFISPTLPTGLSFNGVTGDITGTPTVASAATNYTITAYNTSGSSTTTVNITCAVAPPVISYAGSPFSVAVSSNIASGTIVATNTGSTVSTSGISYNSSGTTILTSSILNKPYAIAFDASGNLYVANSGNNNIVKYNTSGASSVFITSVTNPTGIVFDASGNCYVLSNSSSSVVYKYPSTGGSSGTSFISGLNTAYGLAIDQSGNFYVSNYTGSTYSVKKYNSAGTAQSLTLSNLGTPVNVAISPNGTIYVLNNTGNSVTYYNSSGTYQGTIITGLSGAYGLYCDASGNVYVGDSGNGSIKIYKPDGTSIGTVTLTDVRGIAVDSQGYLYGASNSGNSVTKFTPTNGYFAASLPLGLVLDSTTGEISGTPTTATAATDYTIIAWNSAGSGNTKVNINCNTQHTWISTSSTSWSTAANWSPATVPTASDQVVIGSSSNLATPTLAAGTYTVGSIVMQTSNSQAPSLALSAGATLNVTGAITVNYTSVFGATTITGGTGSVLNASSISVTNNNTSSTNTASLTLSVPTVTLTGNLALTSTVANGGKYENSTFTLSSGILTVKNIQTTNGSNVSSISTLAFGSGTTLNLTGADAFSGLSSTGTNTITGLNSITIGYTGTNNQVVYTDAAISNSSLTSGISYTNIVFGGSGIKTPAGNSTNNINVSGNFTNNLTSNTTSTYVDLSTPTLNLTGTGQTLAGGGGVGTMLYSTVLTGGDKTMSGTFTLDSQSTLSMNGTSSTTLDAGSGSLTLNSDANSSASIGALANSSGTVTGIISGTIKVQRYITGNNDLTYRGYRLLSSSVYDASSSPAGAYFNLSFLRGYASDNTTVNSGSYFTGTGGQTNGFDASGNPTAYFYREDMVPDTRSFVAGNYRGVVKINNSPAYSIGVNTEGTFNMPVGNGVLFFYRGNNGTNISTAPSSLTFTMTGPINQGKITVKPWFNSSSSNLSYTASTGPTDPRYGIVGFNLVGNPYPCSIDWNTAYNNSSSTYGIYAPNTDQSIYIYNAASKNYGVYLNTGTAGGSGTNGTSNIIPAGQGFFVRATSASAQLIFNETAKAPTSQPGTLLLNSTAATRPNPRLRLQFAKDDINKDETLVILNNKAHTEYVQNEDALYLTGTGSVSLSNISADNKALAITQVPVTGSGQTIPLKIRATTQGVYNIDLTEGQDLPAAYDVWLKDAYTKDSLDLKHNTNYNFHINSDTSSTGSKRFSVVLRINSSKMVHLLNFSGVKNISSINLNWTTENEGDYTTYILQHSTDNGKSFSTLDSLTSANLGTYKDLDTNPVSGANLYRLKQIDILGNISYSNVITVMYSLPGSNIIINSRISLFPNPTTNALNLTVKAADNTPETGNFKITVTNTSGIIIKSGTSAQADWHTDVSNLTPGTYFIEVINLKDNRLTGRTSFVKM